MNRNVMNIVIAALVVMLPAGMTGCKRADNSGATQGSDTGMSSPAVAPGSASGASQ